MEFRSRPRVSVFASIFAVGLAVGLAAMASADVAVPAGPTAMQPSAKPTTTKSGLKYYEMLLGAGPKAEPKKKLKVHYTGWLTTGKKFDSSVDRDQPFEFQLGVGQVIKGWDEGIAGMKVGGKRQLHIPAELAYGTRGFSDLIPANSPLIFEVELLEVL